MKAYKTALVCVLGRLGKIMGGGNHPLLGGTRVKIKLEKYPDGVCFLPHAARNIIA